MLVLWFLMRPSLPLLCNHHREHLLNRNAHTHFELTAQFYYITLNLLGFRQHLPHLLQANLLIPLLAALVDLTLCGVQVPLRVVAAVFEVLLEARLDEDGRVLEVVLVFEHLLAALLDILYYGIKKHILQFFRVFQIQKLLRQKQRQEVIHILLFDGLSLLFFLQKRLEGRLIYFLEAHWLV